MTRLTTVYNAIFSSLFFLPTVLPAWTYNMDEPSTCEQRVKVYETPIIVNARSTATPSHPRQTCNLYLEASSTDNAYRLQIIIKSVAIKDSAFRLKIIDGDISGSLLRQLGPGSKTTDMIVTKSSTAVLSLYRPIEQYQQDNDFSLEIKGYRDPDEPEAVFGGSRLAPGAIIGIIVAVLLLIAFAFVLCYMYNTGILTGKRRRGRGSKSSGSKENLSKVPSSTKGSTVSMVTAGLGPEKSGEHIGSNGGGRVNRAYNAIVWNSMLATSQGKGRTEGVSSSDLERSVSRGSSMNIADRPAMVPPQVARNNKAQNSQVQGPDAEYLEPVVQRRSGRLNTVTFDTKPSHFERNFTGGPSQQQNPQSSHSGSGSGSRARTPTDRHSGRSVTSEKELQELPDLFAKDPESKARHSQKSRSPRGSGRDHSPKQRTPSYRYNPSTENKDATETGKRTETQQQQDDDPLLQMNRNSKQRSSNNRSPTANDQQTSATGTGGGNVTYAQIRQTAPSDQHVGRSRDRDSAGKHHNQSENKNLEDKVLSEDRNIDRNSRFSISEEVLQEEIRKQQEQKQQSNEPKHRSKNGVDEGRIRGRQNGRRYDGVDEEEYDDENDLEVKHFHTLAENGDSNSNSIGNSFDFETEEEEPRHMTNPLVNNTYIKKSMQDPTLTTATGKSQTRPHTKPAGQRNTSSQANDNDDDEDVHSHPVHPHFGIPNLVQNSSHQSQNDYSGFPTALNEIMSRTVNSDPNKTYAYGYHTHSDPHHEDSVRGKSAWYMESTPTESGPINTTAFFMQTSQPSQMSEGSSQNHNTPPSAFRSVNGMSGNRLPPEYTSTPANPYAPAASSSPKGGRRGAPKPKTRKNLPKRDESPPRRFPMSIPDPHTIDGISAIEPGQRSAMVRSGFDPTTGCQTSQVMWAEKVPDPTDPGPGDNPSITRKTINRITTRSTYDHLPDNPFPLLAHMHADPSQPSFLSPSGDLHGGIGLLPQPEEISFYTQNSVTAAPVIHEAPNHNKYIKDKISFA